MTERIEAAALFDGERLHDNVTLTHEGGVIVSIEPLPAPPAGPRALVVPAFANAHDHARPTSPTSFGGAFPPPETWLPRTNLATPPQPSLAAAHPPAHAE